MIEVSVSDETLTLLREYSDAGGNIPVGNAVLQPTGKFLVRVPNKLLLAALARTEVNIDDAIGNHLRSLLG